MVSRTIKCPNCGGIVRFDDSQDTGICTNCGYMYICETSEERKDYVALAQAQLDLENYDEALSFAGKAITQNEDDPSAWLIEGIAELMLSSEADNYDNCIQCLKRAVELKFNLDTAFYMVDKQFIKLRDLAEGRLKDTNDRYFLDRIIEYPAAEISIIRGMTEGTGFGQKAEEYISSMQVISPVSSREYMNRGLETAVMINRKHDAVRPVAVLDLIYSLRAAPDRAECMTRSPRP
jgi:tetratricopeptide (TPR) repeat protein